jgi:hypothetical protein
MTQPTSSQPARPATSQSVSPEPGTGTLPPYRVPGSDRYAGMIGVAWGEPLIVCGLCFAVVPGWAVERHDNFHRVWHLAASRADQR